MDNITFLNKIKQVSNGKKVFVAGAGRYGDILGKWLLNKGVEFEAYLDKNPTGELLNEKKVLGYNYEKAKNSIIIISSYSCKDSIMSSLVNNGFNIENVYDIDQNLIYEMFAEFNDYDAVLQRNRRFKNIHKGKRCFIIGNGPSLRIEDLEKLKNEITFGCNSIYALYGYTSWRPTYYVATDPTFCKEMFSSIDSIHRMTEGTSAIFTSILGCGYKFIDKVQNSFFLKTEYGFHGKGSYFSDDCEKSVYASGTVAYFMLQLAVYMGFDEIFLLGIDFSYSIERKLDGTIIENDVVNHMEIIEEEDRKYDDLIEKEYGYYADIDIQLSGYRAAKQYADAHNINIYNATRGGKLEIFERMDFDGLFGN